MKIPGWTKIETKGTRLLHKWRRDMDNSFLEISDSMEYNMRGGYIAVLWTRRLPKPLNIAGGATKEEIYKKAVEYMKNNQ